MNRKLLATLNTITLALMLVVNYLSNTGFFGGKTIGEISKKYETLFVPAGYAFSIWGLIFLMLMAFVGFQWYTLQKKEFDGYISQAGIWFIVSNLANASWVYLWLNEYVAASVLAMLTLLVALIQLMFLLRLELPDAPVRVIVFVWWPIAIYLGWILVATIVNISSYLISTGYDGSPFSPFAWTVIMMVVASLLYIFLIFNRNLRESAMVGVWALVAIAYRHWNEIPALAYIALGLAVIVFVAASYHGSQNLKTSPFLKWKRGEI